MNKTGVWHALRLPLAAVAVLVTASFPIVHAEDAPAPAADAPAPAAAPAADPSATAPAADSAAAPATDSASATPAAEPAAAPAADTSAAPYKLTNALAEIMPKASVSLLLDVVKADGGYVAVGERGHILRSADGVTWKQLPVPTRATLNAVEFVDDKNGWAVGHDAVILHTSDGGDKWEVQHFDPRLEKPFLDVAFLDAQHGFAVGAYGLLLETKDAGQTWNEVTSDIRADEWHFNSITKLGGGGLLIAGESGGLAYSGDAGATWKKLPAPYEGSFFGVLPKGAKGAVAFGLRGNVLVTDDVTANKWAKLDAQTEQGLQGGAVLPGGEVVIVGGAGVVLESQGGIASLKHIPDPGGAGLASVAAIGDKLLVVGESGAQVVSNQ